LDDLAILGRLKKSKPQYKSSLDRLMILILPIDYHEGTIHYAGLLAW